MDKLRAMLRLLCRSLSLSRAGWVPLRRLFMALVIVYILVVRMNPGQFPPSLLHSAVSPLDAATFYALAFQYKIVFPLMFSFSTALPSSYLWISKLIQLLKQMWSVMFKQHYSA